MDVSQAYVSFWQAWFPVSASAGFLDAASVFCLAASGQTKCLLRKPPALKMSLTNSVLTYPDSSYAPFTFAK
jgi:hypothetical protein